MAWPSRSAASLTCGLACSLFGCASTPSPEARDIADANDTGSAVGAHNDGERAILTSLGNLPSGQAKQVAGTTIVAEPAYVAASGRTCRALTLSSASNGKASHRLACNSGSSWFFVPDVFDVEQGGD